jgi:prepilin-type N-terminal cleavage/methylation domain-containing protein
MIFSLTTQRRSGFSLTELTICLALIGIIAAVTLPKLLNVQDEDIRIASFKNTISSVQSLVNLYYHADTTPTLAEFKTFAQTNTKNSSFTDPVLTLVDGSSLRFTSVNLIGSQSGTRIDIDIDGGAGTLGDDLLPMLANFSSVDINQVDTVAGNNPGNMIRPGEVAYLVDPNVSTEATLNALYAELDGNVASGATGEAVTSSALTEGSGGLANNDDSYGTSNRNGTSM